VLRGMRGLNDLWLSLPSELQSAWLFAVERFSTLGEEEVRRANVLHREHTAYDDLRSADASTSQNQRPLDPEDTDPIYRVVAAPMVVNWEPSQNRAPRRRAATEEEVESRATLGVLDRHMRRRIGAGRDSTSIEGTESGPLPTPVGSTPVGVRVTRIVRILPLPRGRVPVLVHSTNATHVESSLAGALRTASAQSPFEFEDAPRDPVPQVRATHTQGPASAGQRRRNQRRTDGGALAAGARGARGQGRRARPITNHTSDVEGMTEEEAEDIDQGSDEEENTGARRRRRLPRAPKVKIPTEEEFQKGYVWRQGCEFDAIIENIRPVQNVGTNHHCLSQRRVTDMYKRLGGPDASLVTPLILRPIAYVVNDIGPENEVRNREVPFRDTDAIRQFEGAYLTWGPGVPRLCEE
jgi:hypothetical protein